MSAWEGSAMQAAQEAAAQERAYRGPHAAAPKPAPHQGDNVFTVLRSRRDALRARLMELAPLQAELADIEKALAAVEGNTK